MQHTAGGHNDEKDILPFSNRLYSCDFAAADYALRLLCLPYTSAYGRVNSVDMRRETDFSAILITNQTIPFMSPQICYKNW